MEIICGKQPPKGLVLVIHSWWGLTQSFRDYAGYLSAANFAVGLSDLFDGRTASSIAEARKLRAMPRKVPMYKSLITDIEALREFGGSSISRVNLVGFSMGGHWAVWLSQRPDLAISSTALYYAARGGSFAESKVSFMAHFAENDPWVSKSARRNMERQIAKAKCEYTSFDYAGTEHWFAETGQVEQYDAAAAQLALERTIAHFRAA